MFNRHMRDFINDLILIYPTVEDFKFLQVGFMTAVLVDKKSPSAIFHENVVMLYHDKIMAKDEDFFMSQSYDYVADSMDVVSKLKAIWQYLATENKEAIWKYLQILVHLSKQCI